jgi:hexosaminidase
MILKYEFTGNGSSTTSSVLDTSGNEYHGENNGCTISDGTLSLTSNCSIATPLQSKGKNYTLSFSVKPTSSTPGTLFSGPESALLAGNGTISNVTLVTGGNAYSLNYSLPVGEWTDVSLIGRGNATFLGVKEANDTTEMEFLTLLGINGNSFVWDQPMAILAPLASIGGGFEGQMKSVALYDGA